MGWRKWAGKASPSSSSRSASSSPQVSSVPPIGCTVVYGSQSTKVRADVVFVHGLRGHRSRTWTKGSVQWIKDYLPVDIPDIRVLSFGYDANILNLFQPSSTNNVHYHAKALLDGLLLHRQNCSTRPIIFVCHSLGGIVCKDALDYSKQNTGFQPALADIHTRVKGIIFLGTPHRGSGSATLAVMLSRIARAVSLDANETIPSAILPNSETLERTSEAFARMHATRTFEVHSYIEELPMPGLGIIVERASGVIGDPYERTSTIYANHQDMCRFANREEPGYLKIMSSIRELLSSVDLQNGPPRAPRIEIDPNTPDDSPNLLQTPQSRSLHLPQARQTIQETSNPLPPRKLKGILREKDGEQMFTVLFEDRCLNIRFHRTVRVPDDGKLYDLPANLGTFPLFNVSKFQDTLPEDAVDSGGFFLPIYQKEAMWISFEEEGFRGDAPTVPFVVRVYAGGVNLVSGLPMQGNMSTFLKARNGVRKQDYLVCPDQPWIDGAATAPKVVRQFVGVPYGSGQSIEAQVTESESVGGIQIQIIPATGGIRIRVETWHRFCVYVPPTSTILDLKKAIGERDGYSSYILKYKGRTLEESETLESLNIGENSEIVCDWRGRPGWTLSDFNIQKESTLHLVLRLRGGGFERDGGTPLGQLTDAEMMAIGAGGKIKQSIIPDTYPKNIWRTDMAEIFNFQMVNSVRFGQITGLKTPPTPISYEAYVAAKIPFYTMDNEPNSSIHGVFTGMKTLKHYDDPAEKPPEICGNCQSKRPRYDVEQYIRCAPCNHLLCQNCVDTSQFESRGWKKCSVQKCGQLILQAFESSLNNNDEVVFHQATAVSAVAPLRRDLRDRPPVFVSIRAAA